MKRLWIITKMQLLNLFFQNNSGKKRKIPSVLISGLIMFALSLYYSFLFSSVMETEANVLPAMVSLLGTAIVFFSGGSGRSRGCGHGLGSLRRELSGGCRLSGLGGSGRRCGGLVALGTRVVGAFAQQLNTVRNNLRNKMFLTILAIPTAAAQPAFYINLRTFVHKSLGQVRQLTPGHDIVPLRTFAHFAAAVAEAFGGCEREGRHFGGG